MGVEADPPGRGSGVVIAFEQDRGHWLVATTEKARWFAEGDHNKLVAVCFCALLKEWGLEFDWFVDTPLVVRCGADQIGCRADTGSDVATMTIEKAPEPWTLAGRVIGNGENTVVLLVGITASVLLDQDPSIDGTVRMTRFLSLAEWRAQFPMFQKGIAA